MKAPAYNIREIESMTEELAFAYAEDVQEIKEHKVYFVDFDGYFGFSALVFKDGGHIYHANDYQLHHAGKTVDELKQWYIDTLNNKLFTDAELVTPCKDYEERKRKEHYIHSYYGLRRPYISAFYISKSPAEDAEREQSLQGKVYDPVSFAYYDDAAFVANHINIYKQFLHAEKNAERGFDYWRLAFKSEMWNHEYCYNWEGDYSVISCFAKVKYSENRAELFKDAGFTDVQISAYKSALREYSNEIDGVC